VTEERAKASLGGWGADLNALNESFDTVPIDAEHTRRSIGLI
jgi:hypothetical protein